jgi:hypothetical protein
VVGHAGEFTAHHVTMPASAPAAHSRTEVELLLRDLNHSQRDLDRSRRDLEQAQAEAAGLRLRAEAAGAEIAALRASTAWRLTSPLRAAMDRIRGRGR